MPNFQTGNFKQKNKKFKGAKGQQKSKHFKNVEGRVQKIKKQKGKADKTFTSNKSARKNNTKQKIKFSQEEKFKMNPNWPEEVKQFFQNTHSHIRNLKIVLVFSLNAFNSEQFVQFLINNYCKIKYTEDQSLYKFKWPIVELDKEKFPQFKIQEDYLFIPCIRQDDYFLNYSKIADILVNLSSVQFVDFDRLNVKPSESMKAIDELGNKCINLSNSQGALETINLILGFDQIPESKQKDVKFYFKRQFALEYPESKTIFLDRIDNISLFLLHLQSLQRKDTPWRDQRGYFLTDKIKVENNKVLLSGTVKNTFSLNELIHITGVGDFAPEQIIVECRQIGQQIKFTPLAQHPMEIFNTQNNLQKIEEQGEMEEEEEQIPELGDIKQNLNDLELGDEEIHSEEDIQFDPDVNILKEDNITKKQIKLVQRTDDEKLFEDEVDYEADIKVRERFKKYKYMKSFITNEWNMYDSLPDYYRKLFVIENPERLNKTVKQIHQKEIIAFENYYITFVLDISVLEQLKQIKEDFPVMVSNLFKHERKMTLNHCRVKFHNLYEQEIKSKKVYTVHAGFRQFEVNMFFSNIYSNVNKFKYCKKIETNRNNWYLASFFQQVYFTPCHALVFEKKTEMSDYNMGELALLGTFIQPDPFKVILKRIVLTGYPYKIKKKHAIVRYMFFNPEDVFYYMKNEVYSKKGLKGKIKESLGTHGLMKILFNGFIKQNDTVCMNLYKRVFPVFPFQQLIHYLKFDVLSYFHSNVIPFSIFTSLYLISPQSSLYSIISISFFSKWTQQLTHFNSFFQQFFLRNYFINYFSVQ